MNIFHKSTNLFKKRISDRQSTTTQYECLKAISPNLLLSQIIGVSPINLNLKPTIMKSLHTLLVLCIYTIISIYDFVQRDKPIIIASANVSLFRIIVGNLQFALGFTCIVFSYIQRYKMIKFFKTICSIDGHLKQIAKLNYRKIKYHSLIWIIVGLTACFFLGITSALVEGWLHAIAKIILSLVLFATFGQFTTCLLLLRERFQIVNARINNIGRRIEFGLITEKMKLLARCHDRLCDAAGIINKAYMVQLLCFITVVFLVTLFALFSNFRIVFSTEPVVLELSLEKTLLKNSAMSIFMVGLTLVILSVCSSTSDEANETGKIVHKIINNNPDSLDIDNLKTFSLQLMHRNLGFNACYMFALDYTLLYTLITASTTYMVILIQFDLAKVESMDMNRNSSL